MEFYQANINQPWQNVNGQSINLDVLCMPLYFHPLFEEVSDINLSNKVLLPKHILVDLSKYNDLMFPLTLKIQDIILGVQDILPDIDGIYIPNYICQQISLNEPENLKVEVLNTPFPKATFLKLKPYESSFYDIIDTRGFLENNLKKYYTHLKKGDIIEFKYKDTELHFDIVETQPEDSIVSLNETNVEVDFERAHDWKPPVRKVKSIIDNTWNPRIWKFRRDDHPVTVLDDDSFGNNGRKLND